MAKKPSTKKKKSKLPPYAATAEGKPRVVKKASGELTFHYLKSTGFRVVHADGIHGGVVPTGRHLHMAFFNERNPIPKTQVFGVSDGRLATTPVRTNQLEGVVREVEFEAILTLATAKAIREWLDKMIETAEAIGEQDRNESGTQGTKK